MSVELDGDDSKLAGEQDKLLQKWLKEIQGAEARLNEITSYFMKPSTKPRLGSINPKIYKSKAIRQNDIISRLPSELKAEVWSFLDSHSDRLMLALTCKWHAASFEEMKKIDQQANRAKKGAATSKGSNKTGQSKPKRVSRGQGARAESLNVLRRLQQWVPSKTWRLCYSCQCFRLKIAKIRPRNTQEREEWGGKSFPPMDEGNEIVGPKSLEVLGHRCPDCVIRHKVDCRNVTRTHLEIKQKLRDLGILKRTRART